MTELAASHVQAWAEHYITATSLHAKLTPAPPPTDWLPNSEPARITQPGRPPELDLIGKTRRSIPRSQMSNPRRRAQLIHTFWHHELQAAELMCWAILAFPDTPIEFRKGLLGICQDEIRHMGLYRDHLTRLGFAIGDFPVRDWFWQRVADCTSPLQFVALMGMGFEGGNLDHTRRFQEWFESVGDREGARLQEIVGDEEVAHVRFAIHWFREWTDGLDFDTWRDQLVDPLTPTMMRGSDLDTVRRERAGFPTEFLGQLDGFNP